MKNRSYLMLLFVPVLFFFTIQAGKSVEPVDKATLGNLDGTDVYLFTLKNKAGNVLKLTNYGAKIVSIEVPDRAGVKENVTLGSETFEAVTKGDPFGGAVVGRFANRISNARFTLDGVEYNLPANNKPNTLHGGNGWYKKVWTAEILQNSKSPSVRFSYVSPDMEEGFPGKVIVEATYTWTDKNEVIIDYFATTDKRTVINVTNHVYFNLHGAGKSDIFDHILNLNAPAYTPVTPTLIPTGEIRQVKGTPFDFTVARPISEKIGETYDNGVVNGYDHNFVLDKKAKMAATVYDPVSGRFMEVITDQPGIQFYSGNAAAAKRNASNPNARKSGFALETQHFPDSPNQPSFPSTVLNPGEKFKSRTIYRFSVKK
jgi:aldose 1-epimerase